MSELLAAPAALGLLALMPVIVILYMLKLKRRPVRVPSTLLWRRSVQDMVANAPFQKLRNNLLMWLQLLALLLLILALARPALQLTSGGRESIIVLIDLSASMQTREANGQTRLDKAKDIALKAIDDMSGGKDLFSFLAPRDEMMIIGFANRTFPLQSMTTDRGALRQAVLGAKALDTETNIEDAGYILAEKTMRMNGDALEPVPDVRIILISDGGLGPTVSALDEVRNLDFVLVGESRNNVGLTHVDLRESFAGTYEQQVFASVFNATAEAKVVFAELRIGNEVLDLKQIDLEAAGEGSVLFTVAEGLTGLASISLVDHLDDFPLDDRIELVIQPPSDLKVLLVSRGNPFLERVFSIDARATVDVLRPDAYTPREGYDIVVFDGFSPKELGGGNFIFVNAVPPAEYQIIDTGKDVKSPRVVDWSRVHPLTRFCNFEPVRIAATMELTIPKDATALVESEQTALITLAESDVRRILVIGFDITKSYWPLDVSFPIFFGNVIESWSRTGRGMEKAVWRAGATIPLVPPRDATSALVETPDGRTVDLPIEGASTLYFTETTRQGVYKVLYGKTQRLAPVGLTSRLESDIRPVDSLTVGGKTIEGTRGGSGGRQEVWPWLVILGLLILAIEWMIYCRRTFA